MELNKNYKLTQPVDDLLWRSKPTSSSYTSEGLIVHMDSATDYWRETYYKPSLIKSNGHLLYQELCDNETFYVEIDFEVNAKNQFDQGGLMLFYDDSYWIKCGLEYVDGKFRLSCVNTNGKSDWSTNTYESNKLSIRMYKFTSDIVVEAKLNDKWQFIRICYLSNPKGYENIKAGLYCCSPQAKGGSVQFNYLTYKHARDYPHKN